MNEIKTTQSQNPSDKRYFPRWEVSNRALFQLENQNDIHEASTTDLSCAGVGLNTHKSFPLDQKIKLIIYLSPTKFIHVTGKIAWIRIMESAQQLGILFDNTPQKTQDTILQYAFEVRHKDVVNNWFKGWSSPQ